MTSSVKMLYYETKSRGIRGARKEKKMKMKVRKNILKILLTTVGMLGVCLAAGCGSGGADKEDTLKETEPPQTETLLTETEAGTVEDGELLSGLHHVEIHIQDMGIISVELDADSAPVTVTNLVNLAESGFYDGLTFHRIMDGFMMQGGDPEGTGMGGSEERIQGEFSANGVDNPLSHTRGAISMARAQDYNSASSQFFIVHEDSVFLDGQYAAFGYVTDGMDIVDEICENTTGQDSNGVVPVENRPVIEKIVVID